MGRTGDPATHLTEKILPTPLRVNILNVYYFIFEIAFTKLKLKKVSKIVKFKSIKLKADFISSL